MKATSSSYQVTVASVLERDGRFLCVEKMVNNVLRLNQPAGRLEVGETPAQGAVRGTIAKSGYSFVPTYVVGIYEYFDVRTSTIFLRLAYTGVPFTSGPRPPRPTDKHIHAVYWLTYGELESTHERHRSPFVLQCVKDFRAGKSFPLTLVSHFPASPAS